jgi:hypothetical protein
MHSDEKKPPKGGVARASGGGTMDHMTPQEIDFILSNAQQCAAYSAQGLDVARARSHAVFVLLLSGGAGMGSLGFAQWVARPDLAAILLASGLWWFAIAGSLAVPALVSGEVRPWAPGYLLDTHQDWCRYRDELVAEGQLGQADTVDIMLQLKLAAVRSAVNARSGYITVSSPVFVAIDQAYKAMTCTPLVALAVLAVVVYWR